MTKVIPKKLIFSLFLVGFFHVGQTLAQQGPDDSLVKLAQNFQTTMLECPERLWPDYSWKGTSVFLIKRSQNRAYKFSDQSVHMTEIDPGILPPYALTSLYSFFQYNNNSALSLDLDRLEGFDQSYAFSLGVHEFFHYHGQRNWTRTGGSRTTSYPVSAKPRLYRRMMFDNLKTYFLSNGSQKESLEKAAYWFQKWKTDYPAEANNTTDGYEGSAKYIEILAGALAQTGCQASDFMLYTLTKDGLFEKMGNSVGGDRFALDSEGYDIGGLSSLILRLIHNDLNWYQGLKTNTTPVEGLLGPVTPLPDEIPDAIERSFFENEQLQNKQLGALVDQDILNFKNPEFIRILIPSKALTSNFSPLAFLNAAEVQGTLTPMGTDLNFLLAQTSIQSKKLAVAISIPNGDPCQGLGGWIFLVNKSQTSLVGNLMSVAAPLVQGQTVGETKVDGKGMTWFCPTPQ